MTNELTIFLLLCLGAVASVCMVLLGYQWHVRRGLHFRIGELQDMLDVEREEKRYNVLVIRDLGKQLRRQLRFVSSVCYELSTSLHAVIGFADLIAADQSVAAGSGAGLSPDDRADVLRQLSDSCRQLASTTGSLSELSYYSLQRSLNTSQRVIVADLIEEVAACYRPLLADGVTLTVSNPLHADFSVLTNSSALRSVLCHVADYAVRHTRQGEIVLGTGLDNSREWLTLSVADSALDAVTVRCEQFFDPADDGDDLRPPVGMPPVGMPLSRIIMRLLGGSISIDAARPEGLQVLIRLPLKMEES